MTSPESLRVGLLLPCRNEAAVIERKLANLARLEWPPCATPHSVLVIDDHSTDATLERALGALDKLRFENVEVQVVASRLRPGKNGAIEDGLVRLAATVDLIVLTDADVLVDSRALFASCTAFQREPELGMACASQVFVQSLSSDGRCVSADGGELRLAGEHWDHLTAWVRRVESRSGRLFSVHGQWLVWRAELGLHPRPGVAADDVDLMLQVRRSTRPKVRMLADARFFECKASAGAPIHSQALRRARAWFQVFESDAAAGKPAGLDALQYWSYAHVPGLLPWMALVLVVLAGALAFWFWQLLGVTLFLALLVICLRTSVGREWNRTLRLISEARRLERVGAMPESWEMSRE